MDTIPIPTNGVKVDVNTELLCISKVSSPPIKMAKYPVKYLRQPGQFEFSIFLTRSEIFPKKIELSNFTKIIKQLHKMNNENNNKTKPIVHSGQSILSNKNLHFEFMNLYMN